MFFIGLVCAPGGCAPYGAVECCFLDEVGIWLIFGWYLVDIWLIFGLVVSLRSPPTLAKNFVCFHVSHISFMIHVVSRLVNP